jgi:hypothetical protein
MFLLLIRGPQPRADTWALAGLAAGLSEHFFPRRRVYLLAFGISFVVHWREAR